MNFFRLLSLALLLCLTESTLAAECGQPVSVDAVKKLSGAITLGDLKSKFGEWCQGHGPISWYKDTRGKEVWFWWQMPNQPPKTEAEIEAELESKGEAEVLAEIMKYRVLVATEVPADNENVQLIIWPPKFVGKGMADVYPGYRR